MAQYKRRMESFGFHAMIVDGHDVSALLKAFDEAAATKGKPSILLCKTYKGKDFGQDIENLMGWHGKSLGPKSADVVKHLRKKLLFPKFEPKIWVILFFYYSYKLISCKSLRVL